MLVTGFAQWCAIDVLREDGSVARVATAPHDGPPLRHDGPHGAAVVMRTGEPELVRHVTEEFVVGAAGDDIVRLRVLREMAPTSYLCVPLMARDRPWGAITLIATDRAFDEADVDLAGELARRAAGAIETGRLCARSSARRSDTGSCSSRTRCRCGSTTPRPCGSSRSTRPRSATTATRATSSSR